MSDGGSSDNVDLGALNDPQNVLGADPDTPGAIDTSTFDWGSDGSINFSNFDFGKAANAILGGSGGGTGAGLALGLGALAAALSRQQAPEIKQPEYKAAPIYNRALTAPLYPPQPAPQKSASGQNIYTPMRGLPLFFNPNPFQFDATEAAKRYGPTPEQIAQGQAGYEAGLASLYKPMAITPISYPGATTVTGATGNDTVAGSTKPLTIAESFDIEAKRREQYPHLYDGLQYIGEGPLPPVFASGGAVDDIFVGYDGGPVGYNDGGDVYMAAGRYLSGGGDGMSDSIPATINNKQPARLADGEFVVPADVVADLGNGSSNAGAKKLYAMMKRIRNARHGTTKQPPEVKTEKAMPA